MNNSDHIEALENALREIAFYLGVGGYNDVNVNPENYKSKILWSIDNLVDTAEKIGYDRGLRAKS